MNNISEDFANIKMPENLDFRLREALKKADKERKKKKNLFRTLKYSAAAAGLVLLYGVGVNTSYVFAATTKKIPILTQLTEVLQIYPDKNIQKAVNSGFAQEIKQTEDSSGIKLTVDSVVADDRKAIIAYTIKTEDRNLNSLLINDLRIMDKDNNLIIDSKGSHGTKNENKSYTLQMCNFQQNNYYTGMVMTTDELNRDFKKTGQLKGFIEISNDSQDTSILDVLNLDISRLVEAYPEPGNDLNEHPDNYNYNSFKTKYNREPKVIDGHWKFNIKLDKKLKSASFSEYNNIKFTASNINFNIEYLKIYPTTVDAKITNDYKDNLVSIGNSYLEDDKGNKFTYIGGRGTTTAERTNYLSYQSPYFSNAKHLYLVVDEIEIGDPDSNPDYKHKIDPVKIQLK